MIIRGLNINDKEFNNFIENFAARETRANASAGIKAMKDIRESVVGNWYRNGLGKSQTINFATEYYSEITQNRKQVIIDITSAVNLAEYNRMKADRAAASKYGSTPYTHAVIWKERHEKTGWTYMNSPTGVPQTAVPMPFDTVGEYLIDMQWKKGILGLPERETQTHTGWVNKKAHIRKPMEAFVASALSSRKWEKTVNSYLD